MKGFELKDFLPAANMRVGRLLPAASTPPALPRDPFGGPGPHAYSLQPLFFTAAFFFSAPQPILPAGVPRVQLPECMPFRESGSRSDAAGGCKCEHANGGLRCCTGSHAWTKPPSASPLLQLPGCSHGPFFFGFIVSFPRELFGPVPRRGLNGRWDGAKVGQNPGLGQVTTEQYTGLQPDISSAQHSTEDLSNKMKAWIRRGGTSPRGLRWGPKMHAR